MMRFRLSPPLLAVTVLWAGLAAEAAAQGSGTTDRVALETLYDAADGGNWTDNTNWKTSAPLNEWYGVSADITGRVVGLQLNRNGLAGSLSPALGNLARLRWLELHVNDLTGPIPSKLGNLENLQTLELGRNDLTGPIPSKLGNLENLGNLSLHVNDLTGPIPSELGNLENLETLYLSGNDLTGPIPSELGNLGNLWLLDLGVNDLTGPIPSELGNLENLELLVLGGNDLTGPIPSELGNLENLELLVLGGNDLTGPIPSELGNLGNLQTLVLEGNGLTGPIPSELGNLGNLERLVLGGNWGLSGSLSTNLRQSPLEELDIFVTQVCAPTVWAEWVATIEFEGRLCGSGTDVTIDVAAFYTPAAREAAGGAAAIETVIDLMVAETNQSYASSEVRPRLALVELSEVPYAETGDSVVDLGRLSNPSDGHMDEVHAVRDRVGADLVQYSFTG